jgi:hypothetical protein
MKVSKRAILACAVISAILVPLAVLGHGWIEEGENRMDRKARLALGESAGGKSPRGMLKRGGGLEEWDVEAIKEKLDLTEEEAAELERLIEEARGLKDQLVDKLGEIKDIIGPKVEERAEEKREDCSQIAEDVKPLLEELKELHEQLCDAVEAEDEEAAEEVRAEIEATTDELREIGEELVDSGCPAIGPRVRKRMEIARDNFRKIVEKMRDRISEGAEKRECLREVQEDLSEEDREALESIKEEVLSMKDDFLEVIENQDREGMRDLGTRISELMKEIRDIYMEKGLCRCLYD